MITNANKPAYPFTGCGDEGLTKREYFAAMAMQGLLSFRGTPTYSWIEPMMKDCTRLADALLVELEKQNDN